MLGNSSKIQGDVCTWPPILGRKSVGRQLDPMADPLVYTVVKSTVLSVLYSRNRITNREEKQLTQGYALGVLAVFEARMNA